MQTRDRLPHPTKHTHTHTITADRNSRGSVSLTNTFSHCVTAAVHLSCRKKTHIEKLDRVSTMKLSRRGLELPRFKKGASGISSCVDVSHEKPPRRDFLCPALDLTVFSVQLYRVWRKSKDSQEN